MKRDVAAQVINHDDVCHGLWGTEEGFRFLSLYFNTSLDSVAQKRDEFLEEKDSKRSIRHVSIVA